MTDVRPFVSAYLAAGWAVVPLVPGEKRAASSWQKRTYSVDDFTSADGVAGKCGDPSGGRVDVDCDAHEAVDAAKVLLPLTGLIHGRPGKPDSHHWYLCQGIKTSQFTDAPDSQGKKATLIEIRSTGGYTALPPSGHPSGDVLAWTIERDPLSIAPDALYAAVRDVAVVALLARRWPGPGARHHFAGHLAGFLVQAGLPDAHVVRLVQTAATLAKDGDLDDRLALVRSTLAKFRDGAKVTGGPTLAETLGDAVVAKLRSWYKLKDLDAIEGLNATHFYVRMGKDAVIGREDDAAGVVFQQPKALQVEYANRKVQIGTDPKTGTPLYKPLFLEWLESPQRRSFKRVVFSPPPCVAADDDYNLWRGYALEPKPGTCEKFLTFVQDVICSGNGDHFAYLVNLLAQTVQAPGTPSGVAVVLRGKSGIGKGVFVRTIGDLFGRRHYTQLDKVEQLAGNFNAALSGKIIVFADEAFWGGDKREVGALKRLITEPTLHIVRKGIDGVDEDNHVHLFMATNEDWSWPAMMHERRGFLLQVSDARMQDTAYFQAIFEELDNGGRAALLALLLEQRVDHALLKRVPKTEELRVQQTKSLADHLEWWYGCLYEGRIGDLGWPDGWVPCKDLYDAYVARCTLHRRRTISIVEFGRVFSKFFSGDLSKVRNTGGDYVRCYKLRPIDTARSYIDDQLGSLGEWPEVAPPRGEF